MTFVVICAISCNHMQLSCIFTLFFFVIIVVILIIICNKNKMCQLTLYTRLCTHIFVCRVHHHLLLV